jgi:membrane associated rhomboid family serine protease
MGSARFAAIYATALLWGSMGALAQTTEAPIVGASGAVFGVVGAMMVELRRRGMDPFSGGLGALLLINLAIGFVIPNIAWGGHIGGLIGGALAALAFGAAIKRRKPAVGYGLCAALSAAAVAGAIAIAQTPHSLMNVT